MEDKDPKWFTILTWLGIVCSACFMCYFLSTLSKVPKAQNFVFWTIIFMFFGLLKIVWNNISD